MGCPGWKTRPADGEVPPQRSWTSWWGKNRSFCVTYRVPVDAAG